MTLLRERHHTVKAIADHFGVHPDTIRRWLSHFELKVIQVGRRGRIRIPDSVVETLREKMQREVEYY